MNVLKYALFAYALTAVISFAVIGVIVFLNNIMNRSDNQITNCNDVKEEV